MNKNIWRNLCHKPFKLSVDESIQNDWISKERETKEDEMKLKATIIFFFYEEHSNANLELGLFQSLLSELILATAAC